MATKKLNTRIQNKIDSEANWNNNPDFIPLKGEMIVYSKDANNKAARVKFGDGVTKLKNLKFSGGSGVPLTPVKKPTVRGSLTYNKSSQTPTWVNYDSSKMTLSGTTSATNAGTYTATFTPLTGYCWEDDESTSAINVTWTINKAPANLKLSSTSLGIDSTFESKTFTYTSDSSGSISVTCVVYTAEGNVIGAALEPSVSGSSITITRSAPVDEISYGTITVTQAATTNYLEATVEIPVQAITGLDGYSWQEIADFVGTSDAGNLGAIGDTKTITLTPNQRIRLPQGEENVKVFLADSFESNGDGTGEAYGYLFAGFKDSEGKDIAITPDPKIRQKQWIPSMVLSWDKSDSTEADKLWKDLIAAAGEHKLEYNILQDGTTLDGYSSITVEVHSDETDAFLGYAYIKDGGGNTLATIQNFGSSFINHQTEIVTASGVQYISKELFNLFKSITIVDMLEQSSYTKYIQLKETIDFSEWSTYSIGADTQLNWATSVATFYEYEGSTGEQYPIVFHKADSSLFALYYSNVRFYDSSDGYVSGYGDRIYRYISLSTTGMHEQTPHFYWLIENSTPVKFDGPHTYWDLSVNSQDVNSWMAIDTMSYEFMCSGSAYAYDGTCKEFSSISMSISVLSDDVSRDFELMEIVGTNSSGNFIIACQESADTAPHNNYDLIYFSSVSSEADWGYFNILLNTIFGAVYTIDGSWIWDNASIISNLNDWYNEKSTYYKYVPSIANISFRAGSMISTDGLPQQQYTLSLNSNSLTYDGPNGDTLISGDTFNSECAAMHFGDAPQALPYRVLEFIKCNATNMSNGFGSGLIDKYAGSNLPLSITLWETPMSRVLGYTVDDYGYGTYQTATNTLYEALPADFKAVLSNIHEEFPATNTTLDCIYSLPYLNEIGVSDVDAGTGYSDYNTSTRLGYSSWGTDPILYYHNGNTTVKYDIWDKTVPVLQHSASMGGGRPGSSTYCLIETSDKTYVKIDNVEELRKPQFVSAGLAPIFLIGSATEEVTCNHNWVDSYRDNDDGSTHYWENYCTECGEVWDYAEEQSHNMKEEYSDNGDGTHHYTLYCEDCGYVEDEWDDSCTKHATLGQCIYCDSPM